MYSKVAVTGREKLSRGTVSEVSLKVDSANLFVFAFDSCRSARSLRLPVSLQVRPYFGPAVSIQQLQRLRFYQRLSSLCSRSSHPQSKPAIAPLSAGNLGARPELTGVRLCKGPMQWLVGLECLSHEMNERRM